jgi:hypothetical protein
MAMRLAWPTSASPTFATIATYYNRLEREGGDLREFLAAQAEVSRDNGRTPMQWSADPNAGFTGGRPWIRVNPDHRPVNVAAAERDTSSVLHYFRRMIQLRKSEPVLVYGRYQLLDRGNPEVFAYARSLGPRMLMVALSFSPKGGRTAVPPGYTADKTLISNSAQSAVQGEELVLGPYQAVVLDSKKVVVTEGNTADTFLDRTESHPNLHALCHDRTRSDARTRESARESQTARSASAPPWSCRGI